MVGKAEDKEVNRGLLLLSCLFNDFNDWKLFCEFGIFIFYKFCEIMIKNSYF